MAMHNPTNPGMLQYCLNIMFRSQCKCICHTRAIIEDAECPYDEMNNLKDYHAMYLQ